MSKERSGNTNKIHRITEDTALKYHDNKKYTNKVDVLKVNQDIRMYERKIDEVEREVKRVESWLKGLDNIETFVIEQFYMYSKQRWDYVIDAFVDTFRDKRSKKQLQRIRDTAMEKLIRITNS